jgi:ADP-ribosylation factor-like protein 2
LGDCKKELHSLLKQEKLVGSSLLIFCNKQDIEGALTMEEIRKFLELDEISTRHWAIIPCSAKTGDGLLEGIDWLVYDISSRIFMMS